MSEHWYGTYFYEFEDSIETCGHRHPTLEEAWACARWIDPDWPADVVLVVDGMVEYTCRREDEEP